MLTKCPVCGQELDCGDEFAEGQIICCPICNTQFEFHASVDAPNESPVVSDSSSNGADNSEISSEDTSDAVQSDSSTKDAVVTSESCDEKAVEDAVKMVDEILKSGSDSVEAGRKESGLKGKIYEDSVSLYDDEARVAFDYFRKAAERIVSEEDAVTAKKVSAEKDLAETEKDVATADAEFNAAMDDAKKAKLWFIGFILIAPIFIAISKLLKAKKRRLAAEDMQKKAAEKMATAKKTLAGIENEFACIKRDYTISKLGVAYVPIATEVPFEDKSFILDDTKKTADSTFDLYQVSDQDAFVGTLTSIKERETSVPVAETGRVPEAIPAGDLVPSFDSVWMNDYLGGMDRDLRAMTYFLRDLKKTSVTLPVIAPQGEYAKFLDEYCTSDTGDMPVLNVFDNSSYSDDLKKFEEINEMKKKMTFSNESLDDVLQNFISEIAENVQYVGRAKIASIGKVLSSCGETLLNTFKASYNHYSPDVAKDEIERLQQEDFSFRSNDSNGIKPFLLSSGSRVRYDAVSSNWVADDGARVSAPLGIHQIQEEIISPLVQNLLKETRIERLKIYNNIIDQKLNYVKEWQKEVDDFYGRGRAEGNDIINQIQVVLGEFTTAYSQYEAFRQTEKAVAGGDDSAPQNMKLAEGSTEKNVIAFKEQADQIDAQKDAFNKYVEDLQGDIERRAGEFSYTEDFEATLRDRHSKDAVMSLKSVETLEERRKVLLAANPYIAENAKIPPEATVNGDELYGRLGKDLRATASMLVEDIECELSGKSEDVGEEKVASSDSMVETNSSSTEVPNDVDGNADGENKDGGVVGESELEKNNDDDKSDLAPEKSIDSSCEVSHDSETSGVQVSDVNPDGDSNISPSSNAVGENNESDGGDSENDSEDQSDDEESEVEAGKED